MRAYFSLVRIRNIFHALHHFGLEGVLLIGGQCAARGGVADERVNDRVRGIGQLVMQMGSK